MRTESEDTRVTKDATGSIVKLIWTCPYCNDTHTDLFFTSIDIDVDNGFEVDRECSYCSKTVTIECPDVSLDF